MTTTPGDWHAVPTDGEPGAGITGFGVLAGEGDGAVLIADGCTEADAKLMAAAPAMLAALKDIAFEFSRVAGNLVPPNDDAEWARIEESLRMARSAIREAGGTKP